MAEQAYRQVSTRTPTSQRDVLFETVQYTRAQRERMTLRLDLLDAYNDGTVVGFFLGIAATVIGWAILSGFLVTVLAAVVERVLYLVRLGGG